MTIQITETNVYIGVIVVLTAMQIYQQYRIARLEKETEELWEQMATLTSSFVSRILDGLKTAKEEKEKK